MRAHWLDCQLKPAAEVPGLDPSRLIPIHPQGPHEPEPAQQIHPIGTLCRRCGLPHAANSAKNAAAGTITAPSPSTSRYGTNRSPVTSSEPCCGTTNPENSRGAPPSLITRTEPSQHSGTPRAPLERIGAGWFGQQVGLAARQVLHMLGVPSNNSTSVTASSLPHRFPIHPGGLHRDLSDPLAPASRAAHAATR